ncbi:hypothetical protein BSKO_00651 [Bryopsis sp. KO-2023]|nr:hypothetical protein BSKO_00651 [Bryopsis sp. KO-2023]
MSDSAPPPPVFRVAQFEDSKALADMNIWLAKETEDIDLQPDVVNAGVKAVMEDESKGTYFLVELDGVVVGQLMITYEWSDWRNARIWWIQSVYVLKEHRRRGYFKALYGYVKKEAQKNGSCGLRLYADVSNERAIKTYMDLGMTSHYKVYEDMFNVERENGAS